MMVFKRKQVVVLALVLMIIVAGYLQYSYKRSSDTVSAKDGEKLGAAVYVNEDAQAAKDTTKKEDKTNPKDSKDNGTNKDTTKNTGDSQDTKSSADGDEAQVSPSSANASKETDAKTDDYFAQAKINKEMSRSRETESLDSITKDTNASKESKNQAYDQMMKLIALSDKEMKVENILKQQGYQDVFALFGEDGSLDILVHTESLTSSKTAQIADAVSRQTGVAIKDIYIKPVL